MYPSPAENKISLATWSLVRSFRAGVWKLTDIHRICRQDFGLDGVELVTTFFEVPLAMYLDRLNQASREHNVQNVLIMVDGEGAMASPDRSERMRAAVNHRKWIEIAAYLGCHAIRCNAYGGGNTWKEDPDSVDRAAESFGALLEYAKEFQVNVIIENHGGLSSDPEWLAALMEKVNSPHFGVLPDYGNFPESVDRYQAVEKLMRWAKGVSVKASWQPDGTHPAWDIERLLNISLKAGFRGFWGIESSMRGGERSSSMEPEQVKQEEWQAVLWTKDVIKKVVFSA
jgi:sugar phosphate isomerase/epimerase